MNNNPILFIDSGIGGLPYLEWLKKRSPEETFVYVADNKNFPFGLKERTELIEIMRRTMLRAVRKYNPKAAVIACNTASVISLAYLRKEFKFPIIGVVPAIKPAAFLSENKKIGLMASNNTIEDDYTEKLIDDFASDCEVYKYAGTEIISFIEQKLYEASDDEKKAVLKPAVDFFTENNVDNIVLGCTHFLLMENELKDMLGSDIKIIDSREGVGRQIIRILNQNNIISDGKKTDYFILTDNSNDSEKIENYSWISEKYGLCAV